MSKGPSSTGQKALAKALDRFKVSKSATHRAIYASLRELDRKHQRLSACITKRATDFEEAEARSASESRQKAEIALQKARVGADKELAAAGKLSVETKQGVAFYEQQLETSILLAKVNANFVASGNAFERHLRNWHDLLVGSCVDALWSDNAIDRVIGLVGAASAIAGFIPPVALAAAGVATALAAIDLRGKFDSARALHIDDVNAARLESAQVLLAFADGLTGNWLSVLRCPNVPTR